MKPLVSNEKEREGYVPNVVYSVVPSSPGRNWAHNIPYAMSDVNSVAQPLKSKIDTVYACRHVTHKKEKKISEKAADKNAIGKNAHPPGYYGRKMMSASDWAGSQIQKMAERRKKEKILKIFHKKLHLYLWGVGVGAWRWRNFCLERTGYRVIDREIMEYMANDSTLTEKIIEFYDERVPGKMRIACSASIEKKFFKTIISSSCKKRLPGTGTC